MASSVIKHPFYIKQISKTENFSIAAQTTKTFSLDMSPILPNDMTMASINSIQFNATYMSYLVLRDWYISNGTKTVQLTAKCFTNADTVSGTLTVWVNCYPTVYKVT